MTSIERVWQHMKIKAAEYARAEITPTQVQAEVFVSYLMREERIDTRPGKDVIEFYARELIALSKEALERNQAV